MNKLFSFPIVSAYTYAITILTQYGYSDYFKIPSNFIEASIKDNAIFFYQLFRLASDIAGFMSFWMWIVMITIVLVFFVLFLDDRIVIKSFFLIFAAIVLLNSFTFGKLVASNVSSFYVLSDNCELNNNDVSYIIPSFYQGEAILVPIDKESRKMKEGFLIKDISGLGCEIKYQEIGKVIK